MGILYLGTQGFAYKDWVGNFYPTHSPPADYLSHYVEHFRAVELNSTSYGVPQPATVRAWYTDTPPDFVFTAKFPRSITHGKQLIKAETETHAFLDALQNLREKCGPLLLQLRSDFGPDRAADLDRFLGALPKAFRYVVEFRHAGWNQTHWEILARHRVALCLHDLYYRSNSLPVTSNFLYVRWLGSRTQLTKFNRVQIDRGKEQARWSEALRTQLGKGLDVYGFVNNRWAGHAPTSAQQLLKAIIEKSQ
jgi:uncharacterized protein YecE (DUF72 family)